MFVPMRKAVALTGLHPNTLRKYADNGDIKCYRAPNGDRMLDVPKFISAKESVICYARVSTTKQRKDLDDQIAYLSSKYPAAEVVSDIASGLNFKRKGLRTVLQRAMSGERVTVVVSYPDRLARFGFELIEWVICESGGKVVVLNQLGTSPHEELVADLMAVITVFSARLHGLRRYRDQIKIDLAQTDSRTAPALVADAGSVPSHLQPDDAPAGDVLQAHR